MTDWRAVRRLVPEVLGALVRRYGHFDACEDAVQEALLAAAAQWPVQGWPSNPRGWLVTVASRRLTDQLRSDTARRGGRRSMPPVPRPRPLVATRSSTVMPVILRAMTRSRCCSCAATPPCHPPRRSP